MLRSTLTALFLAASLSVTAQQTQPAYAWRGCMIDVSRHIFAPSFLQRQIDVLSAAGINRLHLHLTDAGGWRIEVKSRPLLTALTAWRTQSDWDAWWVGGDRQYATPTTPRAYGGYYTQNELQELVAYARARGISIVPEIEMPGHSEEVLTAYPTLRCLQPDSATLAPNTGDLCPSAEETYALLRDVLAEVMAVFPSEYIHIGGDEANHTAWRNCPRCQAKAKALGLSSTDDLQAYLIGRVARWVNARGRRVLVWDEAAKGLLVDDGADKKNAVMVWHGTDVAERLLAQGYDVILTPADFCYLDYYQDAPHTQPRAFGGYLPLRKVYALRPESLKADKGKVLGVQGNLWTEYIETEAQAEYMLYPRILAIAEIGMKGARRRSWKRFRRYGTEQCNELQRQGINAFNLQSETGQRAESCSPLKHKARGAMVAYHRPYSKYYPAGGAVALTDGLRGDWTHTDGHWQGFYGKEALDITLDLGRQQHLRSLSADFMENLGADIALPETLTLSVSADGRSFQEISKSRLQPTKASGPIHRYLWNLNAPTRYLRLQAAPPAGKWLFTDEIVAQ